MNPMSLLTLPPEVLLEMRMGSSTGWPPGLPPLPPASRGPGWIEREVQAFARAWWEAMLTPPLAATSAR